jgi:hypothetical protein
MKKYTQLQALRENIILKERDYVKSHNALTLIYYDFISYDYVDLVLGYIILTLSHIYCSAPFYLITCAKPDLFFEGICLQMT